MTIQQLVYLLETYRCGSISRAAQKLFIAQPNLSVAIREIEAEAGIQIFTRTHNGIQCTELGKEFLEYAQDVVMRFERLQQMGDLKKAPHRMLSVVTARSSEACFSMVAYIRQLAEQGCHFRIRMREGTNDEVIQSVSAGESDVGIVRTNTADRGYFLKIAESKELRLIHLSTAPYVVLFSRDHPLAGERYITQEMLKPYTEVVHGDYEMPMYPFSNYKYHRFRLDEEEKNVIFVYERGTLMDVLANVEGSYVWTSTTHPLLKDRYGLVERVCDAPPVEGQDVIVVDRHRPLTQEMKEFIALLQERAKQAASRKDTSE